VEGKPEDPLVFMTRMKEVIGQIRTKHLRPEINHLVVRKAGNITEADLNRLMNYVEAAYDFIEHNKEQPTL